MLKIIMLLVKENISVNNVKIRFILKKSTKIKKILNEEENNYINC